VKILLPTTITQSSLLAGTSIPEVDTSIGEVGWVSGHHYNVGDRVVYQGVVYVCIQAHTQHSSLTPDTSVAHWRVAGPSNRMAPFDPWMFTKARAKGSITYVISGSFIDGIAVYGISNDDEVSISVKDRTTGLYLIPPETLVLWDQAFGEFDYLFGNLGKASYFTRTDFPINPSIEVSITVSNYDPDVTVEISHISIGNWKRFLSPITNVNGAQYGVQSKTKDYSFVEDNKDGTYTEIPGRKARDLSVTCVISADNAPEADKILEVISGKAVAVEVSNLPKYRHLSTVARISGSVTTNNWAEATVELEMKGNV
jgi:hypothetical protein